MRWLTVTVPSSFRYLVAIVASSTFGGGARAIVATGQHSGIVGTGGQLGEGRWLCGASVWGSAFPPR